MKYNIYLAILLIASLLWLLFSVSLIEEKESKFKKQIGRSFILEKDTLIIIDYSYIQNNFTLSNGKKINSELVFKNN